MRRGGGGGDRREARVDKYVQSRIRYDLAGRKQSELLIESKFSARADV